MHHSTSHLHFEHERYFREAPKGADTIDAVSGFCCLSVALVWNKLILGPC